MHSTPEIATGDARMDAVDRRDPEKDISSPVDEVAVNSSATAVEDDLIPNYAHKFWKRLSNWGVEIRGISPIPLEVRTDTRYYRIFTLWVSMSVNLFPISTGMVATLAYGLSLRDASLVIIFFGLLTTLPVAYFCTFGPNTGLRQIIQARFTFGIQPHAIYIPIFLNMATVTGFVVIGCIVGGQTLSAVSGDTLSLNVGIVIVGILTLLLCFCGYRVIHVYEFYSWIPCLIAVIIATGSGGKYLYQQQETEPATAGTVLSFGALVAGFIIPYAGLASDFSTYFKPGGSTRIFIYTYTGILLPTIPLMILGASIGATVPTQDLWSTAYTTTTSTGGVLAAMLSPLGNFGKFITVLLAFSAVGNTSASLYSVSLNLQMLHPSFIRIPRALFAICVTAVVIPVSTKAAISFFDNLENFIGIIGYWAAAFVAAVSIEHVVFRKRKWAAYEIKNWDRRTGLPTGAAGLGAGVLSFALVVPCMYNNWFVGPVAQTSGDVGFEVAFCGTALLYLVFRSVEVRWRGRL